MIDKSDRRPILLYGPTASGKSALALSLARAAHGCVINADALQVYADWRVLSARPSDEDLSAAPHHLYGHVDAATTGYAAGVWLGEALAVMAEAAATDRVPIIVGGTGLYFLSLTQGLAPIPPTPASVRAAVDAALSKEGVPRLAETLRARDPETAAEIDLTNPRRITRALEVLETTGRGLVAWRRETPPPAAPTSAARAVILNPDPTALAARIAQRFDAMLSGGAMAEVAAMTARNLDPTAPALRALGYAALRRAQSGEISLAEAARLTVIETRQYAKRQRTFARGRFGAWPQLACFGDAVDVEAVARLWRR